MYKFDIDITPSLNGKEIHLEGICEMISSDTFKVTMKEPYKGLSIRKHFCNDEAMGIDATFSQVEKDLIKLYEQGRIESK